MKKFSLLFALGAITTGANAQLNTLNAVTITGTSYTQNFNALTLQQSLPTGWHVFTEASDISLGRYWDTSLNNKLLLTPTAAGTTTARTNWNSTTGNFRNVASGNSGNASLDSLGQALQVDRALAVRQVGATNATFPNSDSGAAFGLKIANTLHKADFAITFKLQSLDQTSPRVTTWVVDYGIGAVPATFTPVTTVGTMTTGGNTFTNNTITADFGTALDSISGPVWIRVVALDPTTGSQNRTTTAIDDFTITYVNNSTSVNNVSGQSALSVYVMGTATSNSINLGGAIANSGNYTVKISDMTGRVVYTGNIISSAQSLSVNDANLQSGLYIIKISNGTETGVVKVNIQ